MIRRNCIILMIAAVWLLAAPSFSHAAIFEVYSEKGATVNVGEDFHLKVSIIPHQGEALIGGQCTLSVDPAMIELPADRNAYAADPFFSTVERFKADPEKGIITFRARGDSQITEQLVFLRIPAKFKKEGISYFSFSSVALQGEDISQPSNPGYFRMAGYSGDAPDPILLASITGDNSLLTTGSLDNEYMVRRNTSSGASVLQAAIGLEEIERTQDETVADVIVDFSKRYATISPGEYIRLDLMLSKFPKFEEVTGVEAVIKFDPTHLKYVNRVGQEATTVDFQERLDQMTKEELLAKAKELNISYQLTELDGTTKSQGKITEELRSIIESYEGERQETYFAMPFGSKSMNPNVVDNSTGVINLFLLVDMGLKREDMVIPTKIVTLIFKAVRPGQNIPVTIEKALIGAPDGKQLIKDAYITIDPDHRGCDHTLPPTLCSGSFTITGNLEFTIQQQTDLREAILKKNTETDDNTTSTLLTKQQTEVDKYTLDQTWNMFLSGSLKNGIAVDGAIHKSPNANQLVDIQLASRNTTGHFGDFNGSLTGTQMVNIQPTQISGIQTEYNFGNFTLAGLMAEQRAVSSEVQITGDGTDGPYAVQSVNSAIPGTIQIIYTDTGEVMGVGKYSIDTVAGEIYFTEQIPTNTRLTIKFEQSTFSISTGNVNALGLAYDSKKDKVSDSRMTFDTAYIRTLAPKGSQQSILNTSETFEVKDHLTVCPWDEAQHEDDATPATDLEEDCVLINLSHIYLVKDDTSYPVTFSSPTMSYTAGTANSGIFTEPRSYYLGRFYLDKNVFTSGEITVQYSYYNPDMIEKDVFTVFELEESSGDVPNITDILMKTTHMLPTNMIHGSEYVFLSSNQYAGYSPAADDFICYDKYQMSLDGVKTNYSMPADWVWERDLPSYCPESFTNIVNSAFDPSKSYLIFENTIDNQRYIYVDKDVFTQSGKTYIKIRYDVAPPEISSGSEFTKTAFGLDTSFIFSPEFQIDMNYAKTNSNLSSSYSFEEEAVLVDASTRIQGNVEDVYVSDDGLLENCNYFGDTNPRLECYLAHDKVHGIVSIKVEHCIRKNNDPTDECEGIKESESEFPFSDFEYTNEEYAYNTNYSYITLEKNNENNPNSDKTKVVFKDIFLTDPNAYNGGKFLNKGDRITFTYLYEKALNKLVEGDALKLKTTYRNKWMNVTLEKDNVDPFFDSTFQGRISEGISKDTNKFKSDVKLTLSSDMSATYSNTNSEKAQLEAGEISSISSSDIANYGINYTNNNTNAKLTKFSATRNIVTNKNLHQTTPIDKTTSNTNYLLNYIAKKNFLDFNGSYKLTDEEDAINTGIIPRHDIAKTLTTNFDPFDQLSIVSTMTRENSSKGKRLRTNKYTVTTSNIPYISSISMNFDRTNNRENETAESRITDNNSYTITLLPVYRFSTIQYSLSQKKTPALSDQVYPDKNDARTITTKFKFSKNLILDSVSKRTRTLSSSATWSLNDNTTWTLAYKPVSSKKGLSLKWVRKDTDTYSIVLNNADAVPNSSFSSQNTYNMAVNPTKKIKVSSEFTQSSNRNSADTSNFRFQLNTSTSRNTSLVSTFTNRKSTSPSKEVKFVYSYYYNSLISFSADLTRTITGYNPSSVKNTVYNLRADYRINEKTTFDFSYKQNITRGGTSTNNRSTSNFIAHLRSNFK